MTNYKQKWLGLTLALAVAFNTLVPFFALYKQVDSPQLSSPLSSVFGEKILICTGDGFAFVSWKDLLDGKGPVKQHKSYACALCYLGANAVVKALLLAVIAIIGMRCYRTSANLFSLYRVKLNSFFHRTAHPRAPPLSFC